MLSLVALLASQSNRNGKALRRYHDSISLGGKMVGNTGVQVLYGDRTKEAEILDQTRPAMVVPVVRRTREGGLETALRTPTGGVRSEDIRNGSCWVPAWLRTYLSRKTLTRSSRENGPDGPGVW